MVNQAVQDYLQKFRDDLQASGFISLKKNEVEVWLGNIEVEWLNAETKKRQHSDHNVKIILGSGFPYTAPLVLSEDSNPRLSPSLHIDPETGALCLWTRRNGWQPYFGTNQLLNRVREWFHCYHTGKWPANSELPDLHLYLNSIGMVVIGEEWDRPKDEELGRFTLWKPQVEKYSKYFPCLATIKVPTSSDDQEPEPRLYKRFPIKPRYSVVGAWFYIHQPFVPPDNLENLLKCIDEQLGWESGAALTRLITVFSQQSSKTGFPLALGYKDNLQEDRWLFLWAEFPQERKQRFKWSRRYNLSKITLKSFRTAPADKNALLRRTAYLSTTLQDKVVTIFGCGSLGSSTALLLAKAGVAKFRLVDHDVLTPGNIVRHACGLESVGLPKTFAVKELIENHFPDCVVEIHESTWDRSKILEYISHSDVVVDTTADQNFSLLLNEECIEANQRFIASTSYRRAQVGRLIIHADKADPCLSCYSDADFWEEDEYPLIPRSKDDEFIEDGCGSVTVEATAIDVEAVANLTARTIIKLLREEDLEGNLIIGVNSSIDEAPITFLKPGIHWFKNSAHPSCAICSGEVD